MKDNSDLKVHVSDAVKKRNALKLRERLKARKNEVDNEIRRKKIPAAIRKSKNSSILSSNKPVEQLPTDVSIHNKDELVKHKNKLMKSAADANKKVSATSKAMKFIKKTGKVASKAAKHIPGIGALVGIGTALATGDASAALPSALESSPLGPPKGSAAEALESGRKLTPDQVKKLLLKNKR